MCLPLILQLTEVVAVHVRFDLPLANKTSSPLDEGETRVEVTRDSTADDSGVSMSSSHSTGML